MPITAALFALALLQPAPGPQQPAAQPDQPVRLTSGLFIDRVTRGGRELIRLDPIAHAIASGAFQDPAQGQVVAAPAGQRTWTAVNANDQGAFDPAAGRGGYAFFTVDSPAQRPMVLEARAHAMVYVNGEPRMGDPYADGAVRTPVVLEQGTNRFLFSIGGRAPFSATLRTPRAPVELNLADVTAPDLVEGQPAEALLGVIILNTTPLPKQASVSVRIDGAFDWTYAASATLAPLEVRKVPVRVPGFTPTGESVALQIRSEARGGLAIDVGSINLRVRRPDQTRKITFLSEIDASVQYYAIVPPAPGEQSSSPALVLSLHGASVEAISQADSYSPKPGMLIACPTNRRPFGFDWEDWGRLDALEVLRLAQRDFNTDPARQYLTGHSMGGHGTWQLGALFPGRFAALGPSAGWISFETYAAARGDGQAPPTEGPRPILRAASGTSDTLAMASNLAAAGVFIVHGDADDNVPVSEARRMAEELGKFHKDWRIHEEPGAGHWFDSGPWAAWPGASCVDFPPLFDFFASRRVPAAHEVLSVDFVTANPGVSAGRAWARIATQVRPLELSRLSLRVDRLGRRFAGTAENVGVLELDAGVLAGSGDVTVELDGVTLSVPAGEDGWISLRREGEGWTPGGAGEGPVKAGALAGPFKKAFDRGFVLVYGTRGDAAENAWAFARARFDAEQWLVRGNGSTLLLSDAEFLGGPELPDRPQSPNVVLYGNAETNAAWMPLLGDGPVRVGRGAVRVDGREIAGDDLGVLLVRPAADGSRLVAVVGGTGLAGKRATDRLPTFVSGVGVPDLFVLRASMWDKGDPGVAAAGIFGPDWSTAGGRFFFAE